MASKVDMFVADKWLPGLFQRFKKEVTLIKVEAEKLNIPFESYHPYYILVYSFIKELMCEDVIVNDKFSRGSFHKIWMLAEETDDLKISLHNQNLPLTKYGVAVKNKCNTSNVFTMNVFQYERNKKRLNFIVESIRNEAKEGGKLQIGLMERVAFFYNTLCYQDPCVTCDMNDLWAKLNEDLICKDPTKINTTLLSPCLLPDITRRTFQTNMKCFLCMFGTVNYNTEPEFYRHTLTTHNSFRIQCKTKEDCKEVAVNRLQLQKHIMERHGDKNATKGMYCKGCGKLYNTLLQLIECEDKCASSPGGLRRLTPYYWEKYYFIWSDVTHGNKIWSYFFSTDEKPPMEKDTTKDALEVSSNEVLEEEVVDQSLFDVSFGSDFDDSQNLVITEVKSIGTPEEQTEKEKQVKDETEVTPPTYTPIPEVVTFTSASSALPSTSTTTVVTSASTSSVIFTPAAAVTSMIAKTAGSSKQVAVDKNKVDVKPDKSKLTRKRKSNDKDDADADNGPEKKGKQEKSSKDEPLYKYAGDLKRAMDEQRDLFKSEVARIESKIDQVISVVNFIKEFIEK